MIKFSGVTKRFSDGSVAFTDLSFEVDPGEMILITGPSGSGKTTIMRLLISEYTPNEGEVFFEERLLNKLRPKELPHHRRQIGVVFQDYKLIEELNVWENVALPLCIKRENQTDIEERVTDLLQLVELTDKALLFPKQLSGGEAQRISIARALANSPKVIFADEPTGNLDQDNSQHIIKLLTKINQLGTTLLLATHDPRIIDQLKVKRVDLSDSKMDGKDDKTEKPPISLAVKQKASPSAPKKKKKITLSDDEQEEKKEIEQKTEEKAEKRLKKTQPSKASQPAKTSRLKSTLQKFTVGLLKARKTLKNEKKDKSGQGEGSQPIFSKDQINQSFKFNEEAEE